jgi:hypothetical protein
MVLVVIRSPLTLCIQSHLANICERSQLSSRDLESDYEMPIHYSCTVIPPNAGKIHSYFGHVLMKA